MERIHRGRFQLPARGHRRFWTPNIGRQVARRRRRRPCGRRGCPRPRTGSGPACEKLAPTFSIGPSKTQGAVTVNVVDLPVAMGNGRHHPFAARCPAITPGHVRPAQASIDDQHRQSAPGLLVAPLSGYTPEESRQAVERSSCTLLPTLHGLLRTTRITKIFNHFLRPLGIPFLILKASADASRL